MSTSNTMLAVDTSGSVLLEQKKEREKISIPVFRVDSMQNAISRFARGEKYLCIVLNGKEKGINPHLSADVHTNIIM